MGNESVRVGAGGNWQAGVAYATQDAATEASIAMHKCLAKRGTYIQCGSRAGQERQRVRLTEWSSCSLMH